MCNHNEVYIKTDKNGTKYYADYTCDRCGGAGGWEGWRHTGWTCYKCGGTGKQDKPHIRKEYTDEYAAKLEARRQKKYEKIVAERKAELHEHFAEHLAEFGFNADGKLYAVVQSNTYDIKDELKAKGARWNSWLNCWTFSEKHDEYVTAEIEWREIMREVDAGWLDYRGDVDIKTLLKEKTQSDRRANASEYVGNVGDRISVNVTLKRVSSWRTKVLWDTVTMFCYRFVDENGNVYVWKTQSGVFMERESESLQLKATIKAHSEYKGEKQTVLTRCKAQ